MTKFETANLTLFVLFSYIKFPFLIFKTTKSFVFVSARGKSTIKAYKAAVTKTRQRKGERQYLPFILHLVKKQICNY